MEKKKAHYDLKLIKKLVDEGKYIISKSASTSAHKDFKYDELDIIDEIKLLNYSDLYKSMTTNENYTIWQDVYKKQLTFIHKMAYIKIQILENRTVIISFKEL